MNRAVVLALIGVLTQDEALKEGVLSYTLKYYKRELRERPARSSQE